MPIVHCETCIYFTQFKEGNTQIGYCRFEAPIILPETSSKRGHFPIMNDMDWCGEGTSPTGERNRL